MMKKEKNRQETPTNAQFLAELLTAAPAGSTVWVNQFIGNPNSGQASWAGKAYSPEHHGAEVDAWTRQNTYFSVGAVKAGEDGQRHRRKANFARLLCLVADDAEADQITGVPSWDLETSPGKFQIGVFLDGSDPDCSNGPLVTALVTQMYERGLIKGDTSGNNIVRYVRLPVGQNQKPRDSGPFNHVVHHWEPSARYSLEDAAGIFGVDLDQIKRSLAEAPPQTAATGIVTTEQDERLKTLTANIIRGENLHDSINLVAASMVASGAKGGAIVNMLRALMEASVAPKDDRWLARFNDIPRSVSTAEEKFRLKPYVYSEIDEDTGELVERPLFTKVSDLLANIKPIQWLVENYLETDALSMVYGPPGGGKSFCVVDLACCIATGTPWHGMPVRQGAVFYIAGEGHNGLARRFAAWEKAHGIKLDASVPLFKSNRAVMMLDGDAAAGMAAEVERLVRETGHHPAMVNIDTLARNFGAGDENKQQDANQYIEHLDRFIRRPYKCNVMTVHHSGHDMDRARGSSVFKGAMDQEIWVKGQMGHIDLTVTKMKDAEIPSPRKFKITKLGLGIEDECGVEIDGAYLEVDGNPLEFKVGVRKNGSDITGLDVARAMYPKWPGVPPMAVALGCAERTLSRVMKAMRDAGMAVAIGNRKDGWELTETAVDHLSLTGELVLRKANPDTSTD